MAAEKTQIKSEFSEKSLTMETWPQVTQEGNSRAIAMGGSARLDRQAFAKLAWCIDVAVRVTVLAPKDLRYRELATDVAESRQRRKAR
jgi:hypothetical protein